MAATVDIPVTFTTPDSSGNAYPTLVSSTMRGVFPSFINGASGWWYGTIHVPQNYASTPVITAIVACSAASAQSAQYTVGSRAVGTGGTWDAAYTTETAVVHQLAAAAYQPVAFAVTLTTTPVAGGVLDVFLQRQGTSASDTSAFVNLIFDCYFSYLST